MINVIATAASRDHRKRLQEFGRIVEPGERFQVTEERFDILSGNNRFGLVFVLPDAENEVVEECCKLPEVEEEPEIFVIEPGKEPVQVDEELKPIEKPKKKKSTKKKTEK